MSVEVGCPSELGWTHCTIFRLKRTIRQVSNTMTSDRQRHTLGNVGAFPLWLRARGVIEYVEVCEVIAC